MHTQFRFYMALRAIGFRPVRAYKLAFMRGTK